MSELFDEKTPRTDRDPVFVQPITGTTGGSLQTPELETLGFKANMLLGALACFGSTSLKTSKTAGKDG